MVSVETPGTTEPVVPPVVSKIADDSRLTASELVEVLAHCNSVTAAACYRKLQAASLIYEEREEEYFAEIGSQSSGEVSTTAELVGKVAIGNAGADPRAVYGPDGLERSICEVGAILCVPPSHARELIVAGSALRYRLPWTGHLLAIGRVDLSRFLIAVSRTGLCDAVAITAVDAELAEELFDRPPMSTVRFRALVDAVVARVDPGAVKRRRELADADRNVSVTPDRHSPGQGRVTASLPMASSAELDAQLNAMADAVHTDDPRTRKQRRADALMTLARGEHELRCDCAVCTNARDSIADPTSEPPPESDLREPSESSGRPESSGRLESSEASANARVNRARPTFHIVVNLTTLLGLDADPGYLDGSGIIDADTVRTLLAEARRTYIRPNTSGASPIPGYTPSRRLDALVRSGELCCTFPGCTSPAWQVDLDHTHPYDHDHPDNGGPTDAGNLKPLCRLHHRVKTFTDWLDYQDQLGTVFFQSPTGHMFVGNGFTGRDLFPYLHIADKPPDHPALERLDRLRRSNRAAHDNAIERWNQANPPPF